MMVRTGTAYQHMFLREEKIFFNVYYQRIGLMHILVRNATENLELNTKCLLNSG